MSGTIAFTSLDGVSVISLGGHVLTGVPQTFADGTTGTLTASYSYDAATGAGVISYSYTLIDNTLVDPSSRLELCGGGDGCRRRQRACRQPGDQHRRRRADGGGRQSTAWVVRGGAATGNVLTGGRDALDGNTTDGVADVLGADGRWFRALRRAPPMPTWTIAATLAAVIQGGFGKLTLNANGSYSYTRDAGTAGGANDVFTYTIKDGDGDLSHTTLTISIGEFDADRHDTCGGRSDDDGL